MASRSAHHTSGLAAGVIAASFVAQSGASGPLHALTLATLVAGLLGGTAPDWLEVAWWRAKRKLWVKHRTITHWGLGWIALLVYAHSQLGLQLWAGPVFGFSAGAVMHLLADWPNPMGVPWLWKRHSLNLWPSGRCDAIVVTLAWVGAAAVVDRVLLHGAHLQYLLRVSQGA